MLVEDQQVKVQADEKFKSFTKPEKKNLSDSIFKPFYKFIFDDLLIELIERKYKKELIQKQSIDLILNSFQKYVDSHTSQNQNSYSR